MRVASLGIVVAVCGCDWAFGLELTPAADAGSDAGCALLVDDEDGDCHANAEDTCPGVTNGDQRDEDGDGVGNACDPNPSIAIDRILAFESFDEPEVAQRWRDASTDVPWRFEPGAARHTSSADMTALLQRLEPVDGREITIEAGFEFVAWAAGNLEQTPASTQLAVYVDSAADLTTGHGCRLDPRTLGASGPGTDAILVDANGARDEVPVTAPSLGQRVRIRLHRRRQPDELRCEIVIADAAPFALELAPTGIVPWPTDRRVGVDAAGVSTALTHVTLYVAD